MTIDRPRHRQLVGHRPPHGGEVPRRGWNVAATLRDRAEWAGEPSDRLLVQALDVRDEASIAAAVTAATDRFGRLDVVNDAGKAINGVLASKRYAPSTSMSLQPGRIL